MAEIHQENHTGMTLASMLRLIPIFLIAGLAACTPQQSTLPDVQEPPTVVAINANEADGESDASEPTEEEVIVITTGLQEPDAADIIAVDDPWRLVERADKAPIDQAATFLLPAVSAFIDAEQYSLAQVQISRLINLPLDAIQQDNLALQVARLRIAQGEHAAAVNQLQQLRFSSSLTDTLRPDVLLFLADSQIALGRSADAASTLIDRDQWLNDEDRIANQIRIVELIGSLDPLSLSILQETTRNRLTEGWIVLSDVLRNTSDGQRNLELQRWRAIYREHPAKPNAIIDGFGGVSPQQFGQLALLLPLTSPFGQAAKAFHDGFMASHAQDPSLNRPAINLYDIGEDPFLTAFYYQAAVNEGAEFVVGPLGNKAVSSLLTSYTAELPSLMIGEIPPEQVKPNVYGISLSPEQEAQQVARRAYSDGHRQAIAFRVDSAWGQRVATAFAKEWQAIGGVLLENRSFPRDISDYSRIIQRLLGIDKSVARHRLIDAQAGSNLKFNPRRRNDVDFIFLAANAGQSRLIVPQLRFFQAHNLPLYATSYIYSGKPNPAVDADLDKVIFGDIDWMIRSDPAQSQSPAASETDSEGVQDDLQLANTDLESVPPFERSPYHHTSLDRLYALGFESYRLIPKLNVLRNDDWQQHLGKTMRISVGPDGNANRELVWATFDQGLPTPLFSGTVSRQEETSEEPSASSL
ncbi:MAG: penicillin-binding protein activator [Pseudomonadota bacterium]